MNTPLNVLCESPSHVARQNKTGERVFLHPTEPLKGRLSARAVDARGPVVHQ